MNLDLSNLTTNEVIIVGLVGIAVMIFGYRIKKVAFFAIWFILGFYLTKLFLPNLIHLVPAHIQTGTFEQLLPLGGGLLLAMLGFSIEKLCVGGICFALSMLITAQYFGTEIQILVAGAVVGIVAAGIAIVSMKPATIIATSVAGAYTVTIAMLVLLENNSQALYFPTLIGLSAIGCLIQFLTTKRIS